MLERLYDNVDVEIPENKTLTWDLRGYLLLRPHVIDTVRNLTVRNGLVNIKSPVYSKRRRSDAGCADGYVGQIAERVPAGQLRSFS